jgi:hypothetical protein
MTTFWTGVMKPIDEPAKELGRLLLYDPLEGDWVIGQWEPNEAMWIDDSADLIHPSHYSRLPPEPDEL